MHTSYLSTIFLAFTALASAYPSSSLNKPDREIRSEKPDDSIAFLQGLTNNRRDMSGRRGDSPEKYFHESTFHAHYDGRFAYTILLHPTRRIQLRALVRAYLLTMDRLRAETWIMHGSLLGWWWNRQIMPWDDDIDVQVSESAIAFLAAYHNMTIHDFDASDLDLTPDEVKVVGSAGKRYLLEINPHYSNPSTSDTLNVIDARWIDIDTGLFIDITTLRIDRNAYPADEIFDDVDVEQPRGQEQEKQQQHQGTKFLSREAHSGPVRMYCKDRHHYLSSQIYPLRTSVFEGVSVKIPYAYQELLAEEYGPESLTETDFWREKYEFVQDKKEWVTMSREKVRQKAQDDMQLKQGGRKQSGKVGKAGKFVQWGERQEAARRMRRVGMEDRISREKEVERDVRDVVLPAPATRD